jgi:hypothetical protein
MTETHPALEMSFRLAKTIGRRMSDASLVTTLPINSYDLHSRPSYRVYDRSVTFVVLYRGCWICLLTPAVSSLPFWRPLQKIAGMGCKLHSVGIAGCSACGHLPLPIARNVFIFRRSLRCKNSVRRWRHFRLWPGVSDCTVRGILWNTT